MRKAFKPRSSMCVWMPASLKGLQKARTARLGFSPAIRFTCSKAPPLVSTRLKHPISIITGAMRSNWSLRGWNLPDDCHMSRYTKLNLIFFFILCFKVFTFYFLIIDCKGTKEFCNNQIFFTSKIYLPKKSLYHLYKRKISKSFYFADFFCTFAPEIAL